MKTILLLCVHRRFSGSPSRIYFSLLLSILLLLPAGGVSAAPKKGEVEAKLSAEEIQTRLGMFYTTFVGIVSSVVERQGASEADIDRLRRLTLVKINAVRACRSTVFQANPRTALIDTWALCTKFKIFLESDQGMKKYGADAVAFREAVQRLVLEIEAVAADVLPPEEVGAIGAKLEAFYRDSASARGRALVAPAAKEIQSSIPDLGWIFNLPLAPFRAMAGVDSSAQSIANLSRTAEAITQTVANLPTEAAWETELLLLQARRDTAALLQDTIEKTDLKTRALIDQLFMRGLQLIAALLAAGLTYRLLVARLIKIKPIIP